MPNPAGSFAFPWRNEIKISIIQINHGWRDGVFSGIIIRGKPLIDKIPEVIVPLFSCIKISFGKLRF